MRLFSMAFAWIFGLTESTESNQPGMEPSYMAADTGDTGEPVENPEDTSVEEETGDTEDSGDTADTADSGEQDTALKSAMDLAGENGGFGCATVEPGAAASILLGVMALGLRRRE